MVNLNILQEKIKDDPEISESVKSTLPEVKEKQQFSFENQPSYARKMYDLLKEKKSLEEENPDLKDPDKITPTTPNISRYYEINKQLLNYKILNESKGTKVLKGAEAAIQGTWKSTANLVGLPVDLTNLMLGMGETGVRKTLDALGFDVASSLKDSKLMSKKPFLGSTDVTKIFNNLGIETEYDKTRWFTRFFGRLGEEIGFGLPIGAFLAKRAAKPIDYLSKEMGITTAAGVGAATAKETTIAGGGGEKAQQRADFVGQLLGGFSPFIIKKLVSGFPGKEYAVESLKLGYNPKKREKEIAGNILYQKLGSDKSAEVVSKIKEREVRLFDKVIDDTKFPRTLDQVTEEPALQILRQQVEESGDAGVTLIQNIDEMKFIRGLELQDQFLQKVKNIDYTSPTTAETMSTFPEYSIQSTIKAVDTRINATTEFFDKRLKIAEETAASKIQAINPNMSREEASSLLRREIDDAYDEALTEQLRLWDEVGGTVNGDIISTGAAGIINSKLKTSPKSVIPEVISRFVNEEDLVSLGLKDQKLDTFKVKSNFGTESISIPTPGKDSVLNKNEPITEIVNLRSQVEDAIRIENSKQIPNKESIKMLDSFLGVIDGALIDPKNARNIKALDAAIDFNSKLKNTFYASEIGSIMGYNTKGKLNVIPENTFNELIKPKIGGGIATKNVNEALTQESKGIQEGLKNRFSELADNTGVVDEATLKKFISNNQEALNEFPLLKSQFNDADEALNIVQQNRQNFQHTKDSMQRFRFETLAAKKGEEQLSSRTIVNNIFKSKDPSFHINKVIKLSREDKSGAALKGLQNEVSDHMLDLINTKEIIVKGVRQNVPDIKKLDSFIKKNKPALISLYGDDGFKTIEEFQTVLRGFDNVASRAKPDKLEVIASNNVFVSSVGRIAGVKVASLTGGPALVFAGIGGRVANNLIAKKAGNEIKALLAEAFIDPDFAAELLKPYVGNQQEVVSKAVNVFLADMFGEEVRQATPEPEISIEFPNATIDETGTIQPKEEEEVPVSMNTVNPASDRFASAGVIPNPIGMRGTGTVDRNKAATLFPDDKIFTPQFAAQGGIMNARKQIQRVA